MKNRAVICHYHIYKNSGSTFDRVLHGCYGDHHAAFDSPIPHFQTNQDQLAEIVTHNPALISLSSHQIYLPLPSTMAFRPVGVVFVRHPLLRIRSIYRFEQPSWPEQSDGGDDTFEGWVREQLDSAQQQLLVSNAQTNQLCRPYGRAPRFENRKGTRVYDIDQAITNLNQVQCLGRTEHFDADVARFIPILAAYGLHFDPEQGLAENTSSSDFREPMQQQLDSMKASLTDESWERLLHCNHQDLEIYDYVSALIDQRDASGFPNYLSKNI
jgi:hypothetical protein